MLYSVGHSNRTLIDFVSILKAHNIDVLADVRGGRAGSRAFPHFNKENLAVEIPKRKIGYIHFPELGGRRYKTKDANPILNEEWKLDAFRYYADYAYYSDEFKSGVDDLIRIGSKVNVAFMCSEAVPWRCHRSIITDWLLLVHNQQVVHLLSEKQTMKGKPHSHAQLYNDSVIYPKTKVMEFFDV